MVQRSADRSVYDILGLGISTAPKKAISFLSYDTVKISILLFFISVVMGIMSVYFPVERLRNYLTSRKLYESQYFFTALLGAITPFCSYSSIPLFIEFVKGGTPLGVTSAYLITSPLINEIAAVLFIDTFGLHITIIYVISGALLDMIDGSILGKMRLGVYLSDWVRQIQQNSASSSGIWEKEHTPFFRRLPAIIREAWGIVRGVFLYILTGIGIGAFMHGYVPEGLFEQYISKKNWFAIPLSAILAVLMYTNAAGIVPVIEVFVARGIPIGIAIAFMMAVVGFSLPEATLLGKVVTWCLIGIFLGMITLFIIMLGCLYNIIL